MKRLTALVTLAAAALAATTIATAGTIVKHPGPWHAQHVYGVTPGQPVNTETGWRLTDASCFEDAASGARDENEKGWDGRRCTVETTSDAAATSTSSNAYVCWHEGDDPTPYPVDANPGEMTAGKALTQGAFSPTGTPAVATGPSGLVTMLSGTANVYLACVKTTSSAFVYGGSGELLPADEIVDPVGFYPAG